MSSHLDREVNILQQFIAEMATDAEFAVREAVRAVAERDIAKAGAVIERDEFIDERENRLEEECLKVLALHQPVARELRYVITLLKVNSELERIGDLAVNIAECALHLVKIERLPAEQINVTSMEVEALGMLKKSLDALMMRDTLAAFEVIQNDDIVDHYHGTLMQKMPGMLQRAPDAATYYLNMLTVSRNIERIADIATNIAEDVIYMEQGRIVRHCHPEK